MHTIYLRCATREAALAALSSVLGYGPEMSPGGGVRWPTAGRTPGGIRYDVDIVGGDGVVRDPEGAPVEGYHVNVLWWGPADTAPDFGAAVITPTTPVCTFAA